MGAGTPPTIVIKWIYQIFSALQFLHSRHIIHGDVKFENIMLKGITIGPEGQVTGGDVKLLDFGFSQHIFNDQPRREIIQTSWFRAPEVILGDPYYDERVDIWSVGVILMKLIFNHIISTEQVVAPKIVSTMSLCWVFQRENTGN